MSIEAAIAARLASATPESPCHWDVVPIARAITYAVLPSTGEAGPGSVSFRPITAATVMSTSG